jgi:hypothetical protein
MNKKRQRDAMFFASNLIIPHIIRAMLEHGIIDLDRYREPQYILDLLKDDSIIGDVLPLIETTVLIHNEFIEMAKLAFENNKKASALVLVATSIEHQFNSFYREILKSKNIDNKVITDIIKTSNFNSKLSWLIKLSSGTNIPDDLSKRIRNIIELRNAIVHYKAKPGKFLELFENSSYKELNDSINKLDFNDVFKMSEDISDFLDALLDSQIESRIITFEIMSILENYKNSHEKYNEHIDNGRGDSPRF